MSRDLVKLSRFLSLHLRHAPEKLGLTLAEGGWVAIDALLAGAARVGVHLSHDTLQRIVRDNDKQRFSFDETGRLVRANQGHSVEVDLQLEPARPPEVLFHGTGSRTVDAILLDGLRKMNRHHVHLSPDVETALRVGRRHGRPVVFEVAAGRLAESGVTFFRSDNGVWLVDFVPPEYLAVRG